jgi:hypothetical protein
MTEEEVQAILGGPPGDYTTRPGVYYSRLSAGHIDPDREKHRTKREWVTDHYAIYVYFASNGKAVLIGSAPCRAPQPSSRYPTPLREILHPVIDP